MPGEVTMSEILSLPVEILERGVPAADAVPDVLSRFLEEQKKDRCAWQIILFFSEHSFVRFNRLAIIHAMNHGDGRSVVCRALDELTEQGVLKVSNEGHLPLYSLADGVRGLVQKLTRGAQRG